MNSACFSRKITLNSQKHPEFANWLANRPYLVWFAGSTPDFHDFEPSDSFADFVAGFFPLLFARKSAKKNPPGKSLAKSFKICIANCPTRFCRGAGQNGFST